MNTHIIQTNIMLYEYIFNACPHFRLKRNSYKGFIVSEYRFFMEYICYIQRYLRAHSRFYWVDRKETGYHMIHG